MVQDSIFFYWELFISAIEEEEEVSAQPAEEDRTEDQVREKKFLVYKINFHFSH